MRAGEWEWRVVVIEHRARPRTGRVTRGAGCGESRSDVVGVCRAGVVRLMAGVAIGRRAGELVVDVA